MTRDQLVERLNNLINNQDTLSTVVYAVLKGTNEIKKLGIVQEAILDVQEVFIKSLQERILLKENQTLIPVSTADERSNTIFEYDLDLPEGLTFLETELNDQLPVFNFNNEDFSTINYLLIEIGNPDFQIKILKKLANIEVFGKGGLMIWRAAERNQRIVKFEDKVLRISPSFNALIIENTYIFMDMDLLERSHGFHEVIIREATSNIKLIEQIQLLETSNELLEMLSNVSFARRVLRVRNSPVLTRNIPNNRIIEFTRRHPSLINKMRYSDDGTKLILHTNVAKELFIKLLDDAYLISELTEQNYESKAKDAVTVIVEEELN